MTRPTIDAVVAALETLALALAPSPDVAVLALNKAAARLAAGHKIDAAWRTTIRLAARDWLTHSAGGRA